MPFRPNINDTITIGKATYRFTEHPSARGMPYGQSGRRGTVYQICADEGGTLLALKVFTQSFRVPRVAEGINALRAYAKLPGLQVCARLALTPGQFPQLIAQHPDLEYAVVMPWVEGKTWQEILLEKEAFSRAQSLQVAKAFSHILVEMETRGVAHCDLSGPNVMIKGEEIPEPQVALVDVEDLFAENLKRPEKLSGGSSGYSHKDASKGLWRASADRFAGSILLAEMLGWCDEDIRSHSFDEQYFPPSETQVSCERYEQLYGTLQTQWGNLIANLFARAWFSETLEECPTLTEWNRAIIVLDPNVMPKQYAWRRVEEEQVDILQQALPASQPITQIGTILPTDTPVDILSTVQDNKASPSSHKRCSLFMLVVAFVGILAVVGGTWDIFEKTPSFLAGGAITPTLSFLNLQVTSTQQAQNINSTAIKQDQNIRATVTRTVQTAQATKKAEVVLSMVPEEVLSNFSKLEFFDAFDKPGDWEVGEYDHEFAIGRKKIQDGKYVFKADTIKDGFIQTIFVHISVIKSFYFQVDARRVEGSVENDCYGIAFRKTGSKYYLLEVCDNGYFSVSYNTGTEWIEISEWRQSSTIYSGKSNRLGVSAMGDEFNIYINNERVYSFKDSKLPNPGTLNLAISLRSKSNSASFEFDNVTILNPLLQSTNSTLLPVSETPPQSATNVVVETTLQPTSKPSSQNSTNVIIESTEKWIDSGINVSKGDKITITQSSGSWTADLGDFEFVDANGYFNFANKPVEYFCLGCDAPIKDGVLGILVAQVGRSIQTVGKSRSFYAEESGRLMLMMNDAYEALDDNSGSITVNISIGK